MQSSMLLNVNILESYFNIIKNDKRYKAKTLQEKLRRLKTAIKFIQHQEDHQMVDHTLFICASRINNLLNG